MAMSFLPLTVLLGLAVVSIGTALILPIPLTAMLFGLLTSQA